MNLPAPLEPPKLDPVVLAVANDYLEGKNVLEIAECYNVSSDLVASILDRQEVKKYVDQVYLSSGYLNRMRRLDIVNKVIEQKMAEALETGVFTKRDLLEWMKLLDQMEQSAKPKVSGPMVAVQVNNLDRLAKELE